MSLPRPTRRKALTWTIWLVIVLAVVWVGKEMGW